MVGKAPARQALNFVQASSWRAPGDPLTGLDQGCHTLRDSIDIGPFQYRHMTDAWVLMMSICDILDVLFGAISKTGTTLSRASLLDALAQTDFKADNDLHIRFSENDRFGAENVRALRADPDCALNSWGCLRPVENFGWLDVAATIREASEPAS